MRSMLREKSCGDNLTGLLRYKRTDLRASGRERVARGGGRTARRPGRRRGTMGAPGVLRHRIHARGDPPAGVQPALDRRAGGGLHRSRGRLTELQGCPARSGVHGVAARDCPRGGLAWQPDVRRADRGRVPGTRHRRDTDERQRISSGSARCMSSAWNSGAHSGLGRRMADRRRSRDSWSVATQGGCLTISAPSLRESVTFSGWRSLCPSATVDQPPARAA